MKIAVKRDQFVGVFCVAVGIAYGLMTAGLEQPMAPDYPGPKAFPYIGVFGLIVCGIGMFVQSTLNRKPQKAFMLKDGWLDVGKSFLALLAYFFGLLYAGYLISTPILLFVLSTIFKKAIKVSVPARLLFALLVTGAIWAFYVYGFGMKLPAGSLFR